MNSAFYTASVGVGAFQSKMNVISNNMANINTTGYRSKTAVFSDLMYHNYNTQGNGHLQEGKGVRLDKTTSNFTVDGALVPTSGKLDFAINGDGFFAVQNLDSEDTLYTRDGRFMMSMIDDTMYLTNSSGQVVLNADEEPIDMSELTTTSSLEELNIGVYTVPIKDGMISDGFNNYRLVEKNGEPELVESPMLLRGYLESANVDMGQEMSSVIEAQRAYSLTLKMVQTADEVEQEVNSLRR